MNSELFMLIYLKTITMLAYREVSWLVMLAHAYLLLLVHLKAIFILMALLATVKSQIN